MPERLRYIWDARLSRYRDIRTGRIVASSTIRRVIDATIRSHKQEARGLADGLRSGRISRERWALEMRQLVRSVHLYQASAARGGFENMDKAAYGQIGGVVANQDQYLDAFIADVMSGAQPLDGRLSNRSAQYVEFGRNTFERANRDVQRDAGAFEERNILKDRAKHCRTCPELTDRGWVPVGTLSLAGERECNVNCRCRMEYRDASGRRVGSSVALGA